MPAPTATLKRHQKASSRATAANPFGVIGLGLSHQPVPGMVTHPDSFAFPVVYEMLHEPHLIERVLAGDENLYDEILAAGRRLVDGGVGAVGTSCGYFSVYQARLAADLAVPVFTSPLLQISCVLATLRSQEQLGVIWASTNALTGPALSGAGVEPDSDRLVHAGMDGPGPFRDAILTGNAPLDSGALELQVIDTCRRMLAKHAEVGAILLECGDVSAYAAAVRIATGLPVYDYLTLLNWARDAT